MAGKFIAVQGCVFDLDEASKAFISGGTITAITPPSSKVLAENKGCYMGQVQIRLDGWISSKGGAQLPTPPAIGVFVPTATKVQIENKLALLEGDKAMGITVTCNDPVPGGTAPIPYVVNVVVLKAGQTKVQGV